MPNSLPALSNTYVLHVCTYNILTIKTTFDHQVLFIDWHHACIHALANMIPQLRTPLFNKGQCVSAPMVSITAEWEVENSTTHCCSDPYRDTMWHGAFFTIMRPANSWSSILHITLLYESHSRTYLYSLQFWNFYCFFKKQWPPQKYYSKTSEQQPPFGAFRLAFFGRLASLYNRK